MASQKKILMILTVVLAAVLIYACIPSKGEEENKIKKVNLDALKETEDETADSLTLTDSVQVEVQQVDTTKQRILLVGESMVEGLSRPFADYCAANGHEYNAVCWYSSTTKHWAVTDTLQHFINKFNPTCGDTVHGTGNLEVHVAQEVFQTLDVGQHGHFAAFLVRNQTHRDARNGSMDRNAGLETRYGYLRPHSETRGKEPVFRQPWS